MGAATTLIGNASNSEDYSQTTNQQVTTQQGDTSGAVVNAGAGANVGQITTTDQGAIAAALQIVTGGQALESQAIQTSGVTSMQALGLASMVAQNKTQSDITTFFQGLKWPLIIAGVVVLGVVSVLFGGHHKKTEKE